MGEHAPSGHARACAPVAGAELCANIQAMADRPRRLLGLAAALALVALVASGCGGSSAKATSSSQSPGTRTTQAQFVAQASRICQGVRTQEQPLQTQEQALKRLPVAKADAAFVSLARQAASIARTADKRLGALARPAPDAREIEALIQAYSAEATDAQNIANAAVNQENKLGEAASIALARSISLNSASANKLGMGDCFGL